MNANHENHDGSDELLRLLGRALGRGPLAGPAEAQAAFDAAAGERLSAEDLAWLLRLTRGNTLSNADTGHFPSAAPMRSAKMNGQRLRTESLERRDATAPLWLTPGLTPLPGTSAAVWDRSCGLATPCFESSDWGSASTTAVAAVSVALAGGVLAVCISSCQRRRAQTTFDEATLYDRALVELADA